MPLDQHKMYAGAIVAIVLASIAALIAIIGVLGAIFGGSSSTRRGNGVMAFWAFVIAILIAGFGLFPFKADYLRYTRITGTVAAVQPRMLGSNNSTTQVYPVEIKGAGVYRCDDSRCSLLKAGDTVSMWCMKVWQWNGVGGWACNFISSTETAGE